MYKKFAKAQLSKLKFLAGYSPKIENHNAVNFRYIPDGFRSVCLISADFEMAWASRYTKSTKTPLQKAINDGIQTRKNVPVILELCDKYDIPITWATVGHLFLEKCGPFDGLKHPDLPRLGHFQNQFWKFYTGDWFDYDPCTDYIQDPAWYAPDLIQDILSRKTKHEIGCHTFSHVDCRDSIDDGKVFEAEIKECQRIAQEWNLVLKSFVHPGHTIGHLDMLKKLGFTSFRTDYGDVLGYPVRHQSGLWEFRNSAGLDWREGWSAKYHIYRYKKIIDRAIKHRRLCVLWFHPSFPRRFVDEVLSVIIAYLDEQRSDILCCTHTEYSDYLDNTIL